MSDNTELLGVGRCLNFFASVIKSGERWSSTCEAEFRQAHAILTAHATPALPEEREKLPDAGFACPYCGKSGPHSHTPEELARLGRRNSAAKAQRATDALAAPVVSLPDERTARVFHYWPRPWSSTRPEDDRMVDLLDAHGRSIAHLEWPFHGAEDADAAEQATYDLADMLAASPLSVAFTGDAWVSGLEDADGNELITIRKDEYAALMARPPASLPDEAKQALGFFLRAYEGIAADSFDGIEERYSVLLQEGANRARRVLGEAAPRLSDPLPDEEAVERDYRKGWEDGYVCAALNASIPTRDRLREAPTVSEIDAEMERAFPMKGERRLVGKIVPPGYVAVPIEPTPEMEEAHFRAHAEAETVFASVPEIWKAMLAASPKESSQ